MKSEIKSAVCAGLLSLFCRKIRRSSNFIFSVSLYEIHREIRLFVLKIQTKNNLPILFRYRYHVLMWFWAQYALFYICLRCIFLHFKASWGTLDFWSRERKLALCYFVLFRNKSAPDACKSTVLPYVYLYVYFLANMWKVELRIFARSWTFLWRFLSTLIGVV